MPLNVASVSIFEGRIALSSCRRYIEEKLLDIPRYRQRIAPAPFNIGLPSWEFDPQFDIKNHVRQVTLKQGTESELKAVAGNILGEVMDRRRPLWDFTLIHGLKGNRTAVVTRMHHCLADGIAGVSLMTTLMDPESSIPPLGSHKPQFRETIRKSNPTLLDELIRSSMTVAEKVLTAEVELCNVFQHMLAAAENAGQNSNGAGKQDGHHETLQPSMSELAPLLSELTNATQPLPFNMICRGPQKFGWTELRLDDIKAIKRACDATVNEAALTLITMTFQRYAELRGVCLKGRLLRIGIPVNVRANGHSADLGNRITFVPITIPLDIRNPRKLMNAIRKRTAFLKLAQMAECVGLFGTLLGTIPTAAQQLLGPIVSQVPLGLCNLIFTNVPGPASPLYLLGHKMLQCYPYVPIGGDLGINCAMLTYCGIAYFGFTGNAIAAPDLDRLAKLLLKAFAELRKSVAAGTGPKVRRTKAETSTPPLSGLPPTVVNQPLETNAKPKKTAAPASEKGEILELVSA